MRYENFVAAVRNTCAATCRWIWCYWGKPRQSIRQKYNKYDNFNACVVVRICDLFPSWELRVLQL